MKRPLPRALRKTTSALLLATWCAPVAGAQGPGEPGPAEPSPLALVEVTLSSDAERRDAFFAMGFDLTEAVDPIRGRVQVVAGPADLARLESLRDAQGLGLEVLHDDVVRFYRERLARGWTGARRNSSAPSYGAWLTPPFAQGSMGGYYTWSEMASVLDQIAAAYPSLVTPKFSLGSSHEGRELWAIKLSDNPGVDEAEPEVRIDAVHHAREPGGMHTALWTLLGLVEDYGTDPLATWIVDHREVWFVPVVNPDGYVYNQTTNPNGGGMWRKNRRNNGSSRGVDLNRNYPHAWGFDNSGSSPTPSSGTYRGPAPQSEPEVAAMVAFMQAREFRTAISAHTYSNLWLAPFGFRPEPPADQTELDEIGALATVINGYPYGIGYILLYPFNGITIDTDYQLFDTWSWLPEIGSSSDGFWPPASRIVPLAEENRIAFYRTILAAGAFVNVSGPTPVELGDGDGHYEPGESFQFQFALRNSGRDATTGTIDLQLTSSSPGLTIDRANLSLPSLASFASSGPQATPLAFTIDPSTPRGSVLRFTLGVTWEGCTETFERSVPVGEPAELVRDDLERDLGWTAGLPSDTASTGLWAFGDPVGTFSAGQASNPSDDASPGGVNCFTTGNGSTSASGDDVDDGVTTLLSPLLDLSSSASATLAYSRWFSDRQTLDDELLVSISDDGGASWVPLESVATQANAWNEASFLVNDFVALTDRVRLRFEVADDPDNSICEAAVDELKVEVYDAQPHLVLYGDLAIGQPMALNLSGAPGSPYWIYGSRGTGALNLPNVQGTILLDLGQLTRLLMSNVPSGGLDTTVVTVPNEASLAGVTFYVQGLVSETGGLRVTTMTEVTF